MPEQNPNKCISGWWLSLSNDERDLISAGLTDAEYEPDATGLKKFVLDLFAGKLDEPEPVATPTDRILDSLGEYITRNPESVRRYAAFAGSAIDRLFNKKGRK